MGGDKLPYFCMLFPLPISPLPAGEGTNLLFTNSSFMGKDQFFKGGSSSPPFGKREERRDFTKDISNS